MDELVVQFVGKSKRAYTNKRGQEAVAHNVTVTTSAGQAGDLYVTPEVYEALNGVQQGQRLRVVAGFSAFRGELSLRVVGLQPVKG